MINQDLKVGDVVKLNSGSPPMTVSDNGIDTSGRVDNYIRCVWFKDGSPTEAQFRREVVFKTAV